MPNLANPDLANPDLAVPDLFADMEPAIKPPPKLEIDPTPQLDEIDLFADMAPEIKAPPRLVLEVQPSGPAASTSTSSKNLFDYVPEDDDDLPDAFDDSNLFAADNLDDLSPSAGWGEDEQLDGLPEADSSDAPTVAPSTPSTPIPIATPTLTTTPVADASTAQKARVSKKKPAERVKLTKASFEFDDF